MACPDSMWPSNEEYLRWFNQRAMELRIPLSGSIELTHRCNLRCVHCYLGHEKNSLQEMNTDKLLSVVDEITEAGCLDLLVTGGEPLLRKDFIDIYRHTKSNGLLVTIFTNGTLVTDPVMELFGDLPPQAVEISVYGATADTYEKISGIEGSFKKCMMGIEKLVDRRIRVKLKTILMTLNRHEFFAIANIAKQLGVQFRFDAAIFPSLNGDMTPLNLRVPPEEAVEKEFADPEMRSHWNKFFIKYRGSSLSNRLYICGAGLTSFHIDPYGNLHPCLMPTDISCDLNKGPFLSGWQNVASRILEKKTPDGHACGRCQSWMLCGYCPAFFGLENHAEDIPSDYLCALGRHRFEMINHFDLKGG